MTAPWTALYLVQTQDFPVLVLLFLCCFLIALWRPQWSLPKRLPQPWLLLIAGFGLSALLAWGTYALMGNFPLSRDEHMVVFDMSIFEKGRAAMPLASQWRPYALALVPEFLLNEKQPLGYVSAYLPMNAVLRLGFSKIADPVWFNPGFVLLGGIALLDIARRIFGPQDRACSVVLLVYALSAQVLANAMTDYSMTGHMALNVIWLAAFLRGGKLGNSVAVLVGLVATGLHQLAFHPVFVAPFLLWKLREGKWKLVLGYVVAYAAIILWWGFYPLLISPLVTGTSAAASDANFLTQRVLPLLLNRDPRTVGLMILNLMRFAAWQNLALVPLLIAAAPVAARQRGLPRALLVGILMWLLLVTLILPGQGRGWGYRYLHGYLSSFCLLAGFGYRELEQRIGRQADGLVLLLSGLTATVSIPLLLSETYAFMQPHVAMQRLIQSQGTPFVLIDDTPSATIDGKWSDTARDHVRNLPDLTNRPLRFSASFVTPELLRRLCDQGPVTLIRRADMHHVGFLLNVPAKSPAFEALASTAARAAPGCFRSAS
jgi:hypothetical protein